MQAIVLTYDKYHVFAEHMLLVYQRLWPDNPFTFRIPYQNPEYQLEYKSKFGDKVKLIQSPGDIVPTIKSLLATLDDNEWIYWCMDDRYPIKLEPEKINQIYNWVKTIDDSDVSAIMFLNSRKGQKPENLYYGKHTIKDPNNNKYRRRKNYTMIWMHQFMRVKVLRHLFSHFPVNLKNAKEMDSIMFKLALPDSHKLYVLNENVAVFGESTSRGLLTKNCYKSLMKNNIPIPLNFALSDKTIVIGNPTSQIDDLVFWSKIILKSLIGKNKGNPNRNVPI